MPKKASLKVEEKEEIYESSSSESESESSEEPKPKPKPSKLEKKPLKEEKKVLKEEKVDKRRTSVRSEKQLESFKKALLKKKENAELRKQINFQKYCGKHIYCEKVFRAAEYGRLKLSIKKITKN